MVRIVRFAPQALVAVAIAVSGTAASSQPIGRDDILITAPHKATLDRNQRSVQFRDLALDRQSGQTALLHRVSYAIDSLCEASVASSNPVGAQKCSAAAWNDVKPQLDQLLRR